MNIEVNKANVKFDGNNIVIELTPELQWELGLDRVKVGDLKEGDTFHHGKYMVIDNYISRVDCICLEPIKEIKFGESNDYRESEVRRFLNDEYKAELETDLWKDPFYYYPVNLKSIEGFNDYGECTDYVSVMTFDQWRRYHKIIGDSGEFEWLSTPAMIPGRNSVIGITPTGVPAYFNVDGLSKKCVRPIFELSPHIMVKR